jgi:hypothetical protein
MSQFTVKGIRKVIKSLGLDHIHDVQPYHEVGIVVEEILLDMAQRIGELEVEVERLREAQYE